MSGPVWEGVSEEGKDIVAKLLSRDPSLRISPQEALEHPWFSAESLTKKIDKKIFQNIKWY